MGKIVFVPPYGEELQVTKVENNGCTLYTVSSSVNVLLNLEKKAVAASQVERIVGALREIPTSEDEVDMSNALSRFTDSLSDKLALAKAELKRLDEAELDVKKQEKLAEQKKKLDALRVKYGF